MSAEYNPNLAQGNVIEAGNVELYDDRAAFLVEFALVIQFDTPKDLRLAMADGRCEFTVFDGKAKAKEVTE